MFDKIKNAGILGYLVAAIIIISIFAIILYFMTKGKRDFSDKKESITDVLNKSNNNNGTDKKRVHFNDVVDVQHFNHDLGLTNNTKKNSNNKTKTNNTNNRTRIDRPRRRIPERTIQIVATTTPIQAANILDDNLNYLNDVYHNLDHNLGYNNILQYGFTNMILNEFNNFLYDDANFNIGLFQIPTMDMLVGTNTNKVDKNTLINGEQVKIRSDSQNVHDSLVNKNIYDTYIKISDSTNKYIQYGDLNDKINKTLEEMYNYYLSHDKFNMDEKSKILIVLDNVKKRDKYQPLNDDEAHILANVWNRTKADDIINSTNPIDGSSTSDNIKYNLGKLLCDVINKNDLMECITGRITRYLSALEINDSVSAPTKTKDILRQEIINRASVIIKNEIDDCYNNKECDWHESAKAYKDNIDVDEKEMKKGKDYLHNKIDQLINEYKKEYNDSPTQINFIELVKQEILAGIE